MRFINNFVLLPERLAFACPFGIYTAAYGGKLLQSSIGMQSRHKWHLRVLLLRSLTENLGSMFPAYVI